MKRFITATMAALIFVLAFAGCGAKSADLKKVMGDINSRRGQITGAHGC